MIYVLGPDVPGLWVMFGALVLGALCGLRVFLAPAALVVIGALDPAQGPESGLLAAVACALAITEGVLDKLGGWDETLDAVGLVWKPIWAIAVVAWQVPLDDTLWLGVVAAAVAALVAVGKARLRQQVESRRRLSFAEDAAAVVLLGCALVQPFLAAAGLLAVGVGAHAMAWRLGSEKWAA